MSSIETQNLTYRFRDQILLDDFTYTFEKNQIIGLLAPVEERISVLLRIICGITEPTSGTVSLNGVNIFDVETQEIRDLRKKIAFVFDRGGILSNLSIVENLLLPLDFHYPEWSKSEKMDLIKYYFQRFQIPDSLLNERPAGIHPQMYKILSLIRAFLIRPSIILYDNPLSDLELRLKKQVLIFLQEMKAQENVMQIFVSTSDVLFEMSDMNLVFKDGRLIEEGSWEDLIISGLPATQKIIKEYLEVGINET